MIQELVEQQTRIVLLLFNITFHSDFLSSVLSSGYQINLPSGHRVKWVAIHSSCINSNLFVCCWLLNSIEFARYSRVVGALLVILADCLSVCLPVQPPVFLMQSPHHSVFLWVSGPPVVVSLDVPTQDHCRCQGEELPTAWISSRDLLVKQNRSPHFISNGRKTALLCPATGPFAHPRLSQFALKMLRICQFVKFLGCGGRWLAVSLPLLLYRISRSQLRCAFTHQTHLATTCCSFFTSVITGGSSWILILNIRRSYSCRVLLRQFKFVA